MENYKIPKSKFVARKQIKINNLSDGQYPLHKNIRFKTPMLGSDLSDYSDACVVLKVVIDLLAADASKNDKAQKMLCLKAALYSGHVYQIL